MTVRSSIPINTMLYTLAAIGLSMTTAAGATADDLSKPVRASSNGHFLLQPDNKPFFWLGDTALGLFSDLTFEEADLYLRSRAKKGFNVVMATATGIGIIGEINGANRYDEKPFEKNDVRFPNERYWKNVDRIIQSATDHGIRVAFLPTWGLATVTRNSRSFSVDENTANTYGRWIARRYKNFGIIWVMGGDTNPIWIKDFSARERPFERRLEDYTGVYDAMASAIVGELGESAFITYYPACCSLPGTAEPRTSLYLGHKTWLNMNFLQSSHLNDPSYFIGKGGFQFGWNGQLNYQPIREEYDSYPARPVIDGEPAAEDIPIDTGALRLGMKEYGSAPRYTDYDTRLRTYHSLFSGAAGAEYTNNNYSWYFYDPSRRTPSVCGARQTWKAALDSAGADQMRHAKDLMLSRPYLTRIPDQSIVSGDPGEGAVHVSATRSRDGDYAMIYLPTGQPVTVDMNRLSGQQAAAWWYDPRTGATTSIKGAFPTNRLTTFLPPSKGPAQDWILVIDDADKRFLPPGAPLQ